MAKKVNKKEITSKKEHSKWTGDLAWNTLVEKIKVSTKNGMTYFSTLIGKKKLERKTQENNKRDKTVILATLVGLMRKK